MRRTPRIRRDQLASLIRAVEDDEPSWNPQELQAILRHQMAAPLEVDLHAALSALPAGTSEAAWKKGGRTFADLLYHPEPPVELLKATRDFAQKHLENPAVGLPLEVVGVLFYASAVVALWRCGKRITRNSDERLMAGITWVLRQTWVDDTTKSLFVNAQSALSSGLRSSGR